MAAHRTYLRAVRQAAGLSQTQLAERVGVSQGAVSRWEHGARLPNVHDAHRVADALDTTVANIWPAEGRPIRLLPEVPAQGLAQNSRAGSFGQVPDHHHGEMR